MALLCLHWNETNLHLVYTFHKIKNSLMGKSSKKVKNERINIIRKQYDAFLEEDKKRRERNEYILGKLDKMRSSTALVPISTKGNYRMEENPTDVIRRSDNLIKKIPSYDNYVYQLERQKIASDLLGKHAGESTILKEISKKYILIPKRRTITENAHYYHEDAIDDNDWKSKYNILDDLKKQEKDSKSSTGFNQNNEFYTQRDSESNLNDKQLYNVDEFDKPISSTNDETIEQNNPKSQQEEQESKGFNDTTLKMSKSNKQDVDKHKIPSPTDTVPSEVCISTNESQLTAPRHEVINPIRHENVQSSQEYVSEKEKYNSDINEKNENYLIESVSNNFQEKDGINDNQVDYPENSNQYNQLIAEQSEYIGSTEDNVSDAPLSNPLQIRSETKPSEPSTLETSEGNMNLNKIAIENVVPAIESENDTHELPSTEHIELYDGNENPEGQILSNQASYDPNQHYEEVQENIPVVLENTEQPENVDHVSEINAFEAEQKEMFYSEQTGGDTYAYNQEEGNTEQYTTDGYEQNDQYAYYEGNQQEQAYATNINEHEESTERYDPHYNQQYEGSYEGQQPETTTDYEHTNAYEQQQYQDGTYDNQFENVVNYETQQDDVNLYQQQENINGNELQENFVPQENEIYDQHLYTEQQNMQEHIEQQLLTEEGYAERPLDNSGELETEMINESETVMNITNPVEQMPEPKLT